MQVRFLGRMRVDFTNKNGESIRGNNIYVGFQSENVDGLQCEKFFVRDNVEFPKDVKLNDTLDVVFDFKGRIENIIKI